MAAAADNAARTPPAVVSGHPLGGSAAGDAPPEAVPPDVQWLSARPPAQFDTIEFADEAFAFEAGAGDAETEFGVFSEVGNTAPPKGLHLLDHFHVPKTLDTKAGRFITAPLAMMTPTAMNRAS